MTTNSIQNAFINALLADASYVEELIDPNGTPRSGDDLATYEELKKRLTPELAKYGLWGQVFYYEIATLSQLHNPVNARVMQANACEFELKKRGHSDILAKYDDERSNPFPFG